MPVDVSAAPAELFPATNVTNSIDINASDVV